MGGTRIALLGGGVWSLFRFAVVALLVLRLVPADAVFHMNLLWIAAPSLVLTALFGGAALVEEARRHYLPLLRIGTLLAAVADAIVILSGSYVPAVERAGPASDQLSRLIFLIVYGILAVDLLILAALISYRPMDRNREPETIHPSPEYESTQVEDD